MSKSQEKVKKPTLAALYKTYRGVCQITGKKISRRNAAVEHILPKSKGGADDWTNCVLVSKAALGQSDIFTGTGPMTGKTVVAARMAQAANAEKFSFDELKAAERRFKGFSFRPKKP